MISNVLISRTFIVCIVKFKSLLFSYSLSHSLFPSQNLVLCLMCNGKPSQFPPHIWIEKHIIIHAQRIIDEWTCRNSFLFYFTWPNSQDYYTDTHCLYTKKKLSSILLTLTVAEENELQFTKKLWSKKNLLNILSRTN